MFTCMQLYLLLNWGKRNQACSQLPRNSTHLLAYLISVLKGVYSSCKYHPSLCHTGRKKVLNFSQSLCSYLSNRDCCAFLTFSWSATSSDQYWPNSLLYFQFLYVCVCTCYSLAYMELQVSTACWKFGGRKATLRRQQKKNICNSVEKKEFSVSSVFF